MVESQLTQTEQTNLQNIYKTATKLRINKTRGADMTQILNEVRGIEGVTTVAHRADYARDTETYNFVIFDIKFELVGSEANPIDYMRKSLVPGLRDIQGIDIQDIQSRPEKLS